MFQEITVITVVYRVEIFILFFKDFDISTYPGQLIRYNLQYVSLCLYTITDCRLYVALRRVEMIAL